MKFFRKNDCQFSSLLSIKFALKNRKHQNFAFFLKKKEKQRRIEVGQVVIVTPMNRWCFFLMEKEKTDSYSILEIVDKINDQIINMKLLALSVTAACILSLGSMMKFQPKPSKEKMECPKCCAPLVNDCIQDKESGCPKLYQKCLGQYNSYKCLSRINNLKISKIVQCLDICIKSDEQSDTQPLIYYYDMLLLQEEVISKEYAVTIEQEEIQEEQTQEPDFMANDWRNQ